MRSLGASLVFREDDGPRLGFTNVNADRDKTKDQSVIRELLQNCLDASADGVCEVRVTLTDAPSEEVPFIGQYKEAFHESSKRLSEEPPTGQQAIGRIKKRLAEKTVTCLICADNGKGIGAVELRTLYGSGISGKGAGSRGSVGHGHLTAFAPSDLRYVLYGGRRDGKETFGGHAILATHKVRNKLRSADGFIRETTDEDQQRPFDEEPGGRVIPDWLKHHIQGVAGSVVAIVGYKPIKDHKPADLILGAATQHFLVAIHGGDLKIDLASNGATQALNSSVELRSAIEKIHDMHSKKRTRRSLATLNSGQCFADPDGIEGVRVWLRKHLEDDEGHKPRVSLFRDGMWIVDNLKNYFEPRYFNDCTPFDAVVNLDSTTEGSLGALARDAEGASHLEIRPNELSDQAQVQALRDCLTRLQTFLSSQADKASDQHTLYFPPELMLMGGAVNQVQPRKRVAKQPDPESREIDDAPRPTPGNGPAPKTRGGGSGSKLENDKQRVRPGNNAGIRTSCRPDNRREGQFHIRWEVTEDSRQLRDLGLRLCIPSGTDRTSRDQVRPEYLDIMTARSSDGSPLAVDGVEARIPITGETSKQGTATIWVRGVDQADMGLVEAEIVRRKRSEDAADDTAPGS